MEEASHLGAVDIIETRVKEDEEASGAAIWSVRTGKRRSNAPSGDEGTPPPVIILHGELEVGQSDGDAGRHDDQDNEDQQQNAVIA